MADRLADNANTILEALVNGALHGMVGVLGDNYSVYMEPQPLEDFGLRVAGETVGIGVTGGGAHLLTEVARDQRVVQRLARLKRRGRRGDLRVERVGLRAGRQRQTLGQRSLTKA